MSLSTVVKGNVGLSPEVTGNMFDPVGDLGASMVLIFNLFVLYKNSRAKFWLLPRVQIMGTMFGHLATNHKVCTEWTVKNVLFLFHNTWHHLEGKKILSFLFSVNKKLRILDAACCPLQPAHCHFGRALLMIWWVLEGSALSRNLKKLGTNLIEVLKHQIHRNATPALNS